jgi:cell division protein FtsL
MSVVWQQSTHGVPRREERVSRVTARVFLLAVVIATALIGAYLALSAANVRLSSQVWTLHNEMADRQREISRLQDDIADASSIAALQARSVELGFAPADAVDFVERGSR